ncbi:MAG: hypothetical protein ABID61_01525 [Candidatus Micrarchaeota archaeon]
MEFLQAYVLTIIIECIVLYFLVRKHYPSVAILKNGIIASTITLPFVWFVFPLLGLPWIYVTLISESFAFVVEGIIYLKIFNQIKAPMAFFCSFTCNVASVVIGLWFN